MKHPKRLGPSPAMVVACLALGIALAGTSYAAITLPKNSVGTKQLKKNAVISSKVKNRSLLAVDFKSGQLPRGAQGPAGSAGPTGATGATGATGPAGPITGNLPAGVTLRGDWGAEGSSTGSSDYRGSTVMFGLRLPAAPTRDFIPDGGVPPAGCPGTPADPQASPGHLCVYEGGNHANVSAVVIFEANSGDGRYGFDFEVFAAAAGNYWDYGTYAVTAPAATGPAGSPEQVGPAAAGTASAR